jgi:hypothetical protein
MHGISQEVLASFAASLQNTSPDASQNVNSLAANFAFAQAMMPSLPAPVDGCEPKRNHATQTHSVTTSSSTSRLPPGGATATDTSRQKQAEHAPDLPGSNTPPFYLFDAPVELRANFMQNQKRLGLPIHHDPNSYHFGKAVRGFHPQQLMNQQQVDAMVAASSSDSQQPNRIPDGKVQLIDARHGNLRSYPSGRVKNEREQKRAAKITELIERIRQDMEDDGWQVEMRSKFYTLSKYVVLKWWALDTPYWCSLIAFSSFERQMRRVYKAHDPINAGKGGGRQKVDIRPRSQETKHRRRQVRSGVAIGSRVCDVIFDI